jgi:hypothetical protein
VEPISVEAVILIPPWSVEKVMVPPLMVDPVRVDVMRLLPCALENIILFALRLDTVIILAVRVLPAMVDTFRLIPLMTGPTKVELTNILFVDIAVAWMEDVFIFVAIMMGVVRIDVERVLV